MPQLLTLLHISSFLERHILKKFYFSTFFGPIIFSWNLCGLELPVDQCFTQEATLTNQHLFSHPHFNNILATTRQNISSGVSDQARHKPACAATEAS